MKTLRLARTAGFCYGVRRAVELAERTAGEGRPCWMLGPVIHNRDEVERLEALGLRTAHSPEEIPDGARALIRSHGESRAVLEGLKARGVELLDATCPNVKRIHELVCQAEEQGRRPVIIGTHGHPVVPIITGLRPCSSA